MASLPNYLVTHRKRHALSQEEVGFLIGANGVGKGSKVSLDENGERQMSLRTALAYMAIYGVSAQELFAGMYEEAKREVLERARLMRHRANTQKNAKKLTFITNLIDQEDAKQHANK